MSDDRLEKGLLMTSQNLAAASNKPDAVFPPRFEASIAPHLRKAYPLPMRVDERFRSILEALARVGLQNATSYREEQ